MFRFVVLVALAAVAFAEVTYDIPVLPCKGTVEEGDSSVDIQIINIKLRNYSHNPGNIDYRYLPRDVRTEHCSEEICTISLTAPIQFEVDAVAREYFDLFAESHMD